MSQYPKTIYLNGEFVPSQQARISVFDRGFMFGDGVYEVISGYSGKLFRLQEHLDRLSYSLKEIKLEFDTSTLRATIDKLIKLDELGTEDLIVYLQITRGAAPRKHSFPEKPEPTCLLYASPMQLSGFEKIHGRVNSIPDIRWHRCDIKSTSLLANVMANQEAHEAGVMESVFIRDGHITEGTHTNIFFVKDRVVFTHPQNNHILNGIMRQTIISLCDSLEIEVRQIAAAYDEVKEMDEAFVTGTTTQVTAIKQFDKRIFYNDEAGPVTKELQQALITLTRG